MTLIDALRVSTSRGHKAVVQLLKGSLQEPEDLLIWDWVHYPWEERGWFATGVGHWSERYLTKEEWKNEDGSYKDNFYPVPEDYDNWVANWSNSLKGESK